VKSFKVSIVLLSMFLVSAAQARGETKSKFKTIVCTFQKTSYGMSGFKIVRKVKSADYSKDDGKLYVNISDSECEDSTLINADGQEAIVAFEAGKPFTATVTHEEPDLKIEGDATCIQK
jgi:hypothetical protein